MTALDHNINNQNFLIESNFKLVIKRSPDTEWFVQRVSIPSISLNPAIVPTPFVRIPQPGDHVDYDMLYVQIKIDEDMNNYLAMRDWIEALG